MFHFLFNIMVSMMVMFMDLSLLEIVRWFLVALVVLNLIRQSRCCIDCHDTFRLLAIMWAGNFSGWAKRTRSLVLGKILPAVAIDSPWSVPEQFLPTSNADSGIYP